MANHLTPTELAREAGLDRRDVIEKTLFLASLVQTGAASPPTQQATA